MMGPYTRTPRYSDDDKNLISEQPGRFVLFSGILLAVLLGLILRGLFTPNKVKSMVESAGARIHKDIQVRFDSAQLSLSRGLLPRFAVVITKVRMESANECWMSPELIADEIRLPLSVWALLKGENPITQVEGGQVQVNLRSLYKNCQNESTELPFEGPRVRQFVTLKKGGATSSSHQQSPPQVQAILIDQLRINSPALTEPLELNGFGLRLKSNSPRVLEVTARTHLLRDDQVGDYWSHAVVWGEYSEFPENTLQMRISGNWREGSYILKANYNMKEEVLASELDLKHIPVSQAVQVLRKFKWMDQEFNGRQVWVSLNAQAQVLNSRYKDAQVQIKDFRLEGDVGEVLIPEARVVSLEPLKYFPFNISIERLNLEKLLGFLKYPHPTPILGTLGIFTGNAEVRDSQNIEIEGVHRGLEFVFSNKGQREVQTLKEISTKMSLVKDHWNIDIAKFQPEQGAFDGTLQIQADRDFKAMELKAHAREMKLAPNVIKLMTAGGDVGAFSGDLLFRFQDGKMGSMKGTVASERVFVEGVDLIKAKFSFDYTQSEIHTQAQVQKVDIATGSPAFLILRNTIEPEWMSDGVLQMKTVAARFNIRNLRHLNWKNFSAQLEKGARMSSEGEWTEDGSLSGHLQVSGSKNPHRWEIGGFRDQPLLTPVSAGRKKSP